jgi:ABC-type multidrug transport system ATPase subunit
MSTPQISAHSFRLRAAGGYRPPELTVSEALRFSARLRLARGTPSHEIQKLIVQTMDQLGLRERASHS